LKGRQLGGLFDWEVNAFRMDFENLVVATTVDGLPALVNAGAERFQGVEIEAEVHFRPDWIGRLTYAYHDAKFENFVQLGDDGEPEQLRGNRLEMSPRHLGGLELLWAPKSGWYGALLYQYVGDRAFNRENTAFAAAYSTWGAAVGYRFPRWELRLQGDNLNDTRPPIAESELGDSQFYLLPARSLRLTLATRF